MILLHDTKDLLNSMKKAGMQAVEASKPVNILFGKVISVSPLKINVEQKMTLSKAQLVLTRNVTDYSIKADINFNTETSNSHSHKITRTKTILVKKSLVVNDEVVLLRMQGGQKYIVLDRVAT